MTRTRILLMLIYCVCCSIPIGMFAIKNKVIGLENELKSIHTTIETNQKALHVLKAEWTYLNTPARIRDLSIRHAKMKPIKGEQIISFSSLPFKIKDKKDTHIIQVSYSTPLRQE